MEFVAKLDASDFLQTKLGSNTEASLKLPSTSPQALKYQTCIKRDGQILQNWIRGATAAATWRIEQIFPPSIPVTFFAAKSYFRSTRREQTR